jgi:F-box and WD-40 domain protein CDC4
MDDEPKQATRHSTALDAGAGIAQWTRTNVERLTVRVHGSSVATCLFFHQQWLITASDDDTIFVLDSSTGTVLHKLEGHTGGIWALAANGKRLLSGSTDRTLRVWNLESGKCTHVFAGHTSTIRCLQVVDPTTTRDDGPSEGDSRLLVVTGSRDYTLRIWALPEDGEPDYNDYDGSEVCRHEVCARICANLPVAFGRQTSRRPPFPSALT